MKSTPQVRKPRLKPFIEYCSINDKVYFFKRPSVAISLDDRSGFIFAACQMMDGTLNTDQLKQKMILTFPKEIEYLDSLLDVLDKEYLLEDISINQCEQLTDYDLSRWSRNIEFFGAYCRSNENKYEPQVILKNTKVVILGLGGVGSHVLINLAAMGVHHFKIIDFDTVGLSNLNRQIIYGEADVGELKADVAKERILAFLPNANVEIVNIKISSSQDVEHIIEGYDFVISAVDYPREHIIEWVNLACVNHSIPFMCGALDSAMAVLYTILPGETGCIECWKSSARNKSIIFQDLLQESGFISAVSLNVTIMPFISILSGLMASEFLKIVTGLADPKSLARMYAYHFSSGEITYPEQWRINSNCNVCQGSAILSSQTQDVSG